jgi:4-amino-4-deoxy-L-arabinose transferase-like glycosyltransferase
MMKRAPSSSSHQASPEGSTERPRGAREGHRPPAWLFLLVYVVSFASLGLAQLGSPDVEITHDGAHYLQIARSLSRGEGFATYTHWALNLPKGPLPSPDTYRAPLYPAMIAVASFLTHDLPSAGKWVVVFSGAFIPPLVLLIAVARLRLPLRWGVLAAAVAITNHHIVIAGSRALTEAPFTAAVLASLYFLTAPNPAPFRAGLATGVAWLLRYQGVIMIPCALAAYALGRPHPSAWLRRSAAFLAAMLLTISPWLVRNQHVTGSPVYTELKYHVVSTYDPDRSFYQYFHGLTPPNEPLSYMVERLDRTVLLFGYRLWRIAEVFGRENAGNPLLFGFAIAGIVFLVRRDTPRSGDERRGIPSTTRRTLQVFGIYTALNLVVVSLTFAKHRHLTSCDPLVAMLTAAGLLGALTWAASKPGRPRALRTALIALMALGISTEVARSYRKVSRTEPRGLEHALAAREVLDGRVAEGEAIMADSPYYFALVFDRPAVSLPWSDDEGLRTLALRYNVKYLCLVNDEERPRYPGSFSESGVLPDWMFEIGEGPDGEVRVIGFDLDRAILADAADTPEHR